MRDKNARCEVGPSLSNWQMEKRLLIILAYKATWLLIFFCVLCRLWLWKMELPVLIGIFVACLSHLTNCVNAVLPSYIPALSLNAQQDRILLIVFDDIEVRLRSEKDMQQEYQ